jgi:transposase
MARQHAKRPRSAPPLHPHAAGIDCGATAPCVAVPEDRAPQPVRSFPPCTADLHAWADGLQPGGRDTGALAATGVSWMPLFEIREARGLQGSLVDPGKINNAPGRQTDVGDGPGMQPRHRVGLVRASWRPDAALCLLRSSRRQRARLGR